jgi:hypothetical protein
MKRPALFALVLTVAASVLPASGALAELSVGNYVLVTSERVSRTEFQYTYRAQVTNTGPYARDVRASVTSTSPNTVVVDGTLSFGDVPSGGVAVSTDTFSIRQNRLVPFDPSALRWTVQAEIALRIVDLHPRAALPGRFVTVTIAGTTSTAPNLVLILNGLSVAHSPVPGRTDAVTFQVPSDARSGPLYIAHLARQSNTVHFSVSEISVLAPTAAEVVLDELGVPTAVNLVLVGLKNAFNTPTEAQRVAAAVKGQIVGRIPLIAGYQLRLQTTTLAQLQATATILRADPAVAFVMIDQPVGVDAPDWSKDPGLPGQRASNEVEEGAAAYAANVHSTEPGKVRPAPVVVGVVEGDGVAFDSLDFRSYFGGAKFNGITLSGGYSPDATTHATTVVGVIAAGLGTGGNAGLLQGIAGHHGGFDVHVEYGPGCSFLRFCSRGENWASAVIAATERMLNEGATVVNWSFGIHKRGTLKRDGTPVTNNVRSAAFFRDAKDAITTFIKNMETAYPRALIVATAGNGDTRADDSTRATAVDSDSLLIVGAHTNGGAAVVLANGFACNDDDLLDAATRIARESYSNYGDRVDISAAGTVRQSDGSATCGTSVAAPLVTATVAAIQSINPRLSPRQIRALLRRSALPIENQVKFGTKVVDVFTAPLTAEEVGTGDPRVGQGARLSVKRAIEAALSAAGAEGVQYNYTLIADASTVGLSSVRQFS